MNRGIVGQSSAIRPPDYVAEVRIRRELDDFDVTLTFCFTPESHGLRPDHTSPPQRVEEFADFCARMTRRYA